MQAYCTVDNCFTDMINWNVWNELFLSLHDMFLLIHSSADDNRLLLNCMLTGTLVLMGWSCSQMQWRHFQTCTVPAFYKRWCSADTRQCCTITVMLHYTACQRRRNIDRYGCGVLLSIMMCPASLQFHQDVDLLAHLHPHHQPVCQCLLLGYH